MHRTCTAALQMGDLSARLDRTVGELDALQHAHAQLSAATAEDAHVLQSKFILARENVRLGVDCLGNYALGVGSRVYQCVVWSVAGENYVLCVEWAICVAYSGVQ
jgi:hypothetical protein